MSERAGGKCECCNVVNVSAIYLRASAIIMESDTNCVLFFLESSPSSQHRCVTRGNQSVSVAML